MSAQLLFQPVLIATDDTGALCPGAKAFFYASGGLVAQATYTTSALSTPNTNPVVADSSGQFDAIYLDGSDAYRMILKTSGGVTLADIDPINAVFELAAGNVPDGTITGVMLDDAAVTDSLGYTPLNKAGDTLGGELRGGVLASLHSDTIGYLGWPTTDYNANHTFAIADAGGCCRHTDSSAYTYTIPTNASVAFPIGTVIKATNLGSGVITIGKSSGVALRLSTTDATVAVAQYGEAYLSKVDTDAWSCSGKGLT